MALSEGQIYLNFNQANAKADELDQAADKLEKEAIQEMQSIISAVGYNWVGDNATAYIAKCKAEMQKLQQVAQNIRKTASTIREIAERLKAAELEALRIAREEEARRERERREQEEREQQQQKQTR